MIYFGCDYYPEQWAQWLPEGEARWATDARQMAEAGFNVVRLAEFAWALLEPAPGQFDFGWLERAVEALAKEGIETVLGTPTPTPPPWLLAAHPDIMQVTADGRRQGQGTRREGCANHPAYQERSRIICQAIAERFAANPNVIGWQTDNEFGCHDSAICSCDNCARAFRSWLQRKFGTLEALNRAWGTAFWGEVYTEWAQIPVPNHSVADRNPGHALDYQRFSSDSWTAFHNAQIAILRATCPNQFVTHNLMGFFIQLDDYDLAAGLDFVSWDNYHHHGATPATIAAAHDHMWGVLRRNFWVIEQQVGHTNWDPYNATPAPDTLRLKSWQGIAHGADGMLYFRWRQALAGSEQYTMGLLDAAGRKTAMYTEAAQIGSELKALAPLLEGTSPQADVAILLDYDSRWALALQPHNRLLHHQPAADFVNPSPALAVDRDERRELQPMVGRAHLLWPFAAPYVALWERNVTTAIVAPKSDLSSYKIVIAPFLNVVTPEVAANLHAFVEGGGTLIVGPRTGFKDEHNRVFAQPQPGPLTDLTGSTVRLIDSLEPERTNVLRWSQLPHTHRTEIGLWAEVLEPDTAQNCTPIAYYSTGWYANQPAITQRITPSGGRVIHVGCLGGPILYDNLLGWLLPLLNVEELQAPVAGVEVAARTAADGRRVVFIINHSNQSHSLTLGRPLVDLLTEQRHERSLHLRPRQVVVYAESARG